MRGTHVQSIDTELDGRSYTQFVALKETDDGNGPLIVGVADVQYKNVVSAGLRRLFIHPDYRRHGIGRLLVHLCIDLACQAGCQSLACQVSPMNAETRPFYMKLGFIIAWQEDDGHCIMALPLQ